MTGQQKTDGNDSEIFIRNDWDLRVPLKTKSLAKRGGSTLAGVFFFYFFLFHLAKLSSTNPPAGLFPLQSFPASCCTPDLHLSHEKITILMVTPGNQNCTLL